jgi:hypothetical protein
VIRLILAAVGLLVALCANAAGNGVLVLAGLACAVPLALKVLALPKVGRSAFLLTAVAAGLVLAVGVAGHHAPTPQRPVAAAHVTEVCHR